MRQWWKCLPAVAGYWRDAGALLAATLRPRPVLRLLDVASGMKEVAATLATLAAPTGEVTTSDLAPEMLALRRRTRGAGGSPPATAGWPTPIGQLGSRSGSPARLSDCPTARLPSTGRRAAGPLDRPLRLWRLPHRALLPA